MRTLNILQQRRQTYEGKKESLIQKIYALRIARDNWKQTEAGKKMKSSKAKSAKLRKALKDLRKLNNITCINAESPGTAVTD